MRTKWCIIEGYPNYEVSNLGGVRRVGKQKELKQYDNKGYKMVYLYGQTLRKGCLVHRLVATAFLQNLNKMPEVNHKNFDKGCNEISNLEWVTKQGNMEHACAKEYVITYPTGECTLIFNLAAFCRDNDLDRGHMNKILTGKRKTHKGFKVQLYKEGDIL